MAQEIVSFWKALPINPRKRDMNEECEVASQIDDNINYPLAK
jgi:hypothetical protein